MTTPDPVGSWAERHPEAPALVTPSEAWTWADLEARVAACAGRLAGRGPRIGVVARTGPDLVVLVLAALRARRTLVPLSTRWTPAMRADALGRLGIRHVVSDGVDPSGVEVRPLDAMAAPGDGASPFTPLDGEAPAVIVHTSGSTGAPKAALLTWANLVWSARGLRDRIPLGPGDRWLLDLPLYHVGGLGVVVRCVLAGATMALPDADMSTADAVRALRPTHASLVSTQLVRLLREGGGEGLRAILLGGSAFPPSLLDEAVAHKLPVVLGYGMTEMASTVTATALPPDRAALATSGRVLPHRDLRIGASGEIEVRGPTLFAGYVEGRTLRRPVDADGWFATGDRGEIDAAGRLVVHGRIGNGFVSGGENVQPERIEAALVALDGVAEAVVVPVPDDEFGERPVAFVRMSEGAVDGARLASALRETLPGFLVPDAVLHWSGPTGIKPDRPALAREAQRRLGRG